MEWKRLIRYFLIPAFWPIEGIRELGEYRRKTAYGVLIFLFLGVIYTVSVQLACMKGLGAQVTPFLAIPADEYYRWQRFYQIPFFFVTSIVFAGTVRLLSEAFGGQGSFEGHFALFSVAQTLPMFLTMWVPETIYFVFFGQAT